MEEELSPQERMVLSLLARGYDRKGIAAELYIEVNTVKFHMRNILWKLNARNRTHAVAIAYEESILIPNGRLF